jgi:hypothetical protein
MEKLTQQQIQQNQQTQTQLYFVTFACKVDPAKAKEILAELRKIYPKQTPIFTPKPPRGRKTILQVAGTLVILTFPFPYTPRQEKQEQAQSSSDTQGTFTLKELIKNKKI